jgi:hypothetical protein
MIEGFGSGSVPQTNGTGAGSRRPKTHMDPTDPDPQHGLAVSSQGIVRNWIWLDSEVEMATIHN